GRDVRENTFPPRGRERRKHAIRRGPCCRVQAPIELRSACCETEHPRTTIIAINAALDESRHDQLLHQQAPMGLLNTEPCSETVLIDIRFIIEVRKRRVL